MQIPKLTTIADLNQPQETKQHFISQAMQLSRYFTGWKAQDEGGYEYTVHVGGTRERAPGIHASEISKCRRLMVYSIRGEERRPPATGDADVNMQMRFDVGTAIHAMLQHQMKLMCDWLNQGSKRVTFEDEVAVNPQLQEVSAEWGLHSHCDGVFTFWHEYAPGHSIEWLRVGLEIKTASEQSFDKLKKPYDDHYEQTCLYMAALDLPLMWTLYYNKSNSNFTNTDPPWIYQFDQALWDKLEVRFAKSQVQAEVGDIPPREEGRHCGWCPYSWKCMPPYLKRRNFGPARTVQSPGALKRR